MIAFIHLCLVMKRLHDEVTRSQCARKIQKWYRRQKNQQRQQRCIELGIDPMEQCPFNLVYIYEIPEEKLLILSINGVKRASNLIEYIKMINQSDFLTIPRHYWNSYMSNEDFESILKRGREYLSHLRQKHSKYVKMENDNIRKIANYAPLYSRIISNINDEIIEVDQLVSSVAQTNYYRSHVNQKFEQLEKEYHEKLEELNDIYEKHPCIGEQAQNRIIKLTESHTLSEMYLPVFLEKKEQQIEAVEKMRIHIDELYHKAGWQKRETYMEPEKLIPEKTGFDMTIPSAPPPYTFTDSAPCGPPHDSSPYGPPIQPKPKPRKQRPPRPPPPKSETPKPAPRKLYPDLSTYPVPSAPPAQ